jgi:hypothetical protein
MPSGTDRRQQRVFEQKGTKLAKFYLCDPRTSPSEVADSPTVRPAIWMSQAFPLMRRSRHRMSPGANEKIKISADAGLHYPFTIEPLIAAGRQLRRYPGVASPF